MEYDMTQIYSWNQEMHKKLERKKKVSINYCLYGQQQIGSAVQACNVHNLLEHVSTLGSSQLQQCRM